MVASTFPMAGCEPDPITRAVIYMEYSRTGPSAPIFKPSPPPKSCPDDVNLPCTQGTYGDLTFAPDGKSVFVTYSKIGGHKFAVRVDLDDYKQVLVPPPFCGVSVDLIDVSHAGLMVFGVSRSYADTYPVSDPKFRPSGVAIVPQPGASPWAFDTNRRVSHMALSGDGRMLFMLLAHPSISGDHLIQGFDLLKGEPVHAITRQPSDILINEFKLIGMISVHRVWADVTGARLLLLAQTRYTGEAMFDPVRKGDDTNIVPLSAYRFLFEIDTRDGSVALHGLNAALARQPNWGLDSGVGLADFGVASNGDILFTLMHDTSKGGEVVIRRYRDDRIDSVAQISLPMASGVSGWLRRFAISPDGRWLAFQYKAPSDGVANEIFAVFDRSSGAVRPVDAERVPRDPQLAKTYCPSS